MNKAILSCLLLLPSPCLFAQDVIVMKDSTKIEARVENISETQIQFRKYGNTDLSTYYVDKKDALRINFENGDVKNFGTKEKSAGNYIVNADEMQFQNHELLKYRRGRFSLINDQGEILKRKLKGREMRTLLKNNVALDYYKTYRVAKIGTYVTGGMGIAILGTGLGYLLLTDPTEFAFGDKTGLYAAWFICFAGEVTFAIIRHNSARKTERSFNEYLDNSRNRYSLNFGLTGNGVGLVLKF